MARVAKGVALAAIIAASISVASFAPRSVEPSVRNTLANLPYRPTLGRLSDQPQYRAYTPRVLRLDAALELEAQLTPHPLPNRLDQTHAVGVTRLLFGNPSGAIQSLREARALAEAEPVGPERRAAVINDFAVAHLELARTGSAKSFIIALDAAEKAWELDRTPAIAWTRAVLLSSLATDDDVASSAWDDYLALDHSSEWATAARRERRPKVAPARRAVLALELPASESLPTAGSTTIEHYDRLFETLINSGDRESAATVLIQRAEVLGEMRAADEAWGDLMKARGLSSGHEADKVVEAIARAAARQGYLRAARALRPQRNVRIAWSSRGILHLAGHTVSGTRGIDRGHLLIGDIVQASAAFLWLSDRERREDVPTQASLPCSNDPDEANPIEMGRNLARCVPPGVTLIQQDLAAESLRTWVIRDGRIEFTSTPVSAPRLIAEIERFTSDIQRDADHLPLRLQAQHLYDLLLRPVQAEIAGTDLLVYSASQNLRNVPVGALHDGSAFLVERRPVTITATVSSFEVPAAAGRTASALVVLPSAAPKVMELRGAQDEVRELGQLYGARSTLLTGGNATPEAFLDSASEYDIVHVATHGQPSDLPYQNAIDFGPRRIRAYDVFRLHLRRAPIVMLAACRTADESGGPMNISLTHAFLTAGASSVVGSLWDVEDRETAALSVAFHRQLVRGATPYDALRTVQLQFIRRGAPIGSWAAFQVNS